VRVSLGALNIRLEEHKLCLLVMIGVRADGRKELVALADGYRESVESWADLLRDGKRRGMRAPVLAIGDGALGFWGALRDTPALGTPHGYHAPLVYLLWLSSTGRAVRAVPWRTRVRRGVGSAD